MIVRSLVAASMLLLGPTVVSGESDAKKGRSLFQEKGCTHCHTIEGAGGTIGPRMDGVGKRLNKDQIVHQITFGGNNMPPFGDALTPEEIHQLVEYLSRSKKEIKPPPAP